MVCVHNKVGISQYRDIIFGTISVMDTQSTLVSIQNELERNRVRFFALERKHKAIAAASTPYQSMDEKERKLFAVAYFHALAILEERHEDGVRLLNDIEVLVKDSLHTADEVKKAELFASAAADASDVLEYIRDGRVAVDESVAAIERIEKGMLS